MKKKKIKLSDIIEVKINQESTTKDLDEAFKEVGTAIRVAASLARAHGLFGTAEFLMHQACQMEETDFPIAFQPLYGIAEAAAKNGAKK